MTKIKELRQKMNMTQKQFSEFYQIPLRTIQQWEQGKRKAPPYFIKLLNEKIEHEAKGEQLNIIF